MIVAVTLRNSGLASTEGSSPGCLRTSARETRSLPPPDPDPLLQGLSYQFRVLVVISKGLHLHLHHLHNRRGRLTRSCATITGARAHAFRGTIAGNFQSLIYVACTDGALHINFTRSLKGKNIVFDHNEGTFSSAGLKWQTFWGCYHFLGCQLYALLEDMIRVSGFRV